MFLLFLIGILNFQPDAYCVQRTKNKIKSSPCAFQTLRNQNVKQNTRKYSVKKSLCIGSVLKKIPDKFLVVDFNKGKRTTNIRT